MNASIVLASSIVLLFIAYHTWGNFVRRRLRVNEQNAVPSHTLRDGIDFEPAPRSMVLGHHFASIAGAGPIVGPIVAMAFGWLPALIWILVGSVFLGAVHDFTALVASLRHEGRSVGDLIEDYVGVRAKRLFIIFALATLILVIAVFTDVVVQTLLSSPSVASANIFFILGAIFLGVLIYRGGLPFSLATPVALVLLAGTLALAYFFPLELGAWTVGGVTIAPRFLWIAIIMAYIGVAAVSPVWLIMQPRDFLNSFLLYGMMAVAIGGIFVTQPTLQAEAFRGLHIEGVGRVFPLLFVTVACGAISGFHSLVASGTTSKQLDSEADAQFIGYGAMLIEAVLAVVALIAAAAMTTGDYMASRHDPIGIFSRGIASFIKVFGIPEDIGVVLIALTISAFALTTLDTCTRLARFLLQELFEKRSEAGDERPKSILATNRFLSTGIVVAISTIYCLSGKSTEIWPVFGSANQLLAAVSLLSVSTWLARKQVSNLFVVIPMFFMYFVTVVALLELIYANLWVRFNIPLALVSSVLLLLSLELLRQALGVLRPTRKTEAQA